MKIQQNDDRPRIAKNCICCGSDKLLKSPAVLMPFVAHRVFDWAPVEIDETWGLRTVKQGHAYSICNTLFCTRCECIFLDIRFDDEELGNLYRDYRGTEYTNLRETYEPSYSARNSQLVSGVDYTNDVEQFLRKHIGQPNSVLDWGGDTGKNTPFKDARTRDIYDISPRKTVSGTRFVTKEQAYGERYDLVVCSNVLEHTPFPADVLNQLLPCLREETMLYIELPYEKLFSDHKQDQRIHKRHWHEHVNFFTERSIRYLLANLNVEIIDLNVLRIPDNENDSKLFQIACKTSA
jgi:hypothetical protein